MAVARIITYAVAVIADAISIAVVVVAVARIITYAVAVTADAISIAVVVVAVARIITYAVAVTADAISIAVVVPAVATVAARTPRALPVAAVAAGVALALLGSLAVLDLLLGVGLALGALMQGVFVGAADAAPALGHLFVRKLLGTVHAEVAAFAADEAPRLGVILGGLIRAVAALVPLLLADGAHEVGIDLAPRAQEHPVRHIAADGAPALGNL